MSVRSLFRTLLLAALLAAALTSCAWLEQHAAKPAPAPAPAAEAANATAPAELAPAPEALAPEPEAPKGVQESDLNEPNPPGTKQKFGKKDAAKAPAKDKASAKAKAGDQGAEQCYKLSRPKKGRCEPQCIPYARCRTGIDSCRLGKENNSITWFSCEQKHKNTTDEPAAGMVMILKANTRRNMPSGHSLVVEKATPQGKDAWLLVVSHANWDTRCSLETNAKALYNRKTMRVAFLSGEWKDWATDLVVAGFIKD